MSSERRLNSLLLNSLKYKLLIFEGIAATGKSTVLKLIYNLLKDYCVTYDFEEGLLLYDWKHTWIPNIAKHQLSLGKDFLELVSKESALFLVNRFHISFAKSHRNLITSEEFKELLSMLASIRHKTFYFSLSPPELKKRVKHTDRPDLAWKFYQQKRAQQSLTESYENYAKKQQEFNIDNLKNFGLNCEIINTDRVFFDKIATKVLLEVFS